MPGLPEVKTVAPCSPHDPSGCFAVGVRPVDIPHHGPFLPMGYLKKNITRLPIDLHPDKWYS